MNSATFKYLTLLIWVVIIELNYSTSNKTTTSNLSPNSQNSRGKTSLTL